MPLAQFTEEFDDRRRVGDAALRPPRPAARGRGEQLGPRHGAARRARRLAPARRALRPPPRPGRRPARRARASTCPRTGCGPARSAGRSWRCTPSRPASPSTTPRSASGSQERVRLGGRHPHDRRDRLARARPAARRRPQLPSAARGVPLRPGADPGLRLRPRTPGAGACAPGAVRRTRPTSSSALGPRLATVGGGRRADRPGLLAIGERVARACWAAGRTCVVARAGRHLRRGSIDLDSRARGGAAARRAGRQDPGPGAARATAPTASATSRLVRGEDSQVWRQAEDEAALEVGPRDRPGGGPGPALPARAAAGRRAAGARRVQGRDDRDDHPRAEEPADLDRRPRRAAAGHAARPR